MNFEEIKAGKLLSMESGEYSDYAVDGFFVVLKSFKPHEEFLKHHEGIKDKPRAGFDRYNFITHLCKEGLIMDIDYEVIYQGGYGDLKEGDFKGLEFGDVLKGES